MKTLERYVTDYPEPTIFTREMYLAARERFVKRRAKRQAAKADFATICERLSTEPRQSFGNFTLSFETIVPSDDMGTDQL